jgi:hypothetical protein
MYFMKNIIGFRGEDDPGESRHEPRYDAFISYARDERETIARPLYEHLTALGLRVWFDEHEVNVGDSIPDAINRGMRNSDFGIVVLSEGFMERKYTVWELEGILFRKLRNAERRKVLLPLYYGVDEDDVGAYSPPLASLHALTVTDENVAEVAEKLYESITGTTTAVYDPDVAPEMPESPLRERIRARVDRGTTVGELSEVVREEVVNAIEEIQDEHVPGPIPDAFWEEVLGVYDQTISETSRETITRNFEEFREAYRRAVLIESEPVPAVETRSGQEVSVKRPWRPADLYTEAAWRERAADLDVPEAVQPHVVVLPGEFTADWLHATQYAAHLVGLAALGVDRELARQHGRKPLWKLLGELGEVPSGTLGRIGFVVSSNVRRATTLFQANLREYLGYLVLREAFRARENGA